ncbi:uncharacterized protein LOC130636991 [Hydractinia symbiolongicarpus]|uniref:uncharacterized protein LOC130636991 n=1 Tax=Hydractinia symbiolongicarpus TaxID=13093 RepID=UPI00254F4178|nr:uncharacterized protein LOC130636991 [Hydractinia symbiolongicarpus]
MKLFDHEYFFKQFRISPFRFEHLLSLIAPIITKCSLRREAISPSERLCLTLRYLVTGDSQVSIACSYRVSPTSITRIVAETCEALWTMLLREGYLRCPITSEEWKKISQKFEELWNFPNCHHSIVLLAVCNATYEFTLVVLKGSSQQNEQDIAHVSAMFLVVQCYKFSVVASHAPQITCFL